MARSINEIQAERSELRAKMDRITAQMEEIHQRAGDRELTPGEQENWDRLAAGRKKAELTYDELDGEMRSAVARLGGIVTESGDGAAGATASVSRTDAYLSGERGAALRCIETLNKSRKLPDNAAEKATALVETSGTPHARSLASRWVTTAGDEAYLSAFVKLCADPTRGHLLWDAREQAAYRAAATLQAEMRAAMSTTDANGGYMIPMTLDPAIHLTSDGSINPLRRISRVVQTSTESWTGITSAGATAEWKAEAAQAADGSPTVDDEPIPVHFGDVFVPYSYEIGMDAANFLQELRRVMVDAADNLQAAAYTTGSGSGQPTGIVTALAGTASEINTTGSEAIVAADAFALQNALPARFSARAQWMGHIATQNTFRQFETTNGALKFPELANGVLLGKPFHENSNMDGSINAAATANNYVLIYGDFSEFVIVDRIGSTIELIPNLMGANQRPTGQRGAFLWFRTGSDVLVTQAFRMLDVPTTA